MEFETVREALQYLLEMNDPSANVTASKEEDKAINNARVRQIAFDLKPANAKDIQEVNYEALAGLADLLGMSDLYLEDNSEKKD